MTYDTLIYYSRALKDRHFIILCEHWDFLSGRGKTNGCYQIVDKGFKTDLQLCTCCQGLINAVLYECT